jgi:hypothetical protein
MCAGAQGCHDNTMHAHKRMQADLASALAGECVVLEEWVAQLGLQASAAHTSELTAATANIAQLSSSLGGTLTCCC